MRHLSAMGYLIEIGVDEYRLTNFMKAMSIPAIGNSYLAMYAQSLSLSFLLVSCLHPQALLYKCRSYEIPRVLPKARLGESHRRERHGNDVRLRNDDGYLYMATISGVWFTL